MPPSLRCPRCSTVVTVPDGQAPACSSCGFGKGIPTPLVPSISNPSNPPPPLRRPHTVTAASILAIAIAAGMVLVSLAGLVLFLGGLTTCRGLSCFGAGLAVFFAIIAAMTLAIGVLRVLTVIGVLAGKSWALMAQTILSSLSVIVALVGSVGFGPSLRLGSMSLSGWIPLLMELAILVLLFARPSRRYFNAASPQG